MRLAQLRVLGGAMARVPADATAFAHRQSRIMVNVAAFYEAPTTRLVPRGLGDGVGGRARAGRTPARTSTSSATRERSASAPPIPEPTWDRLAAIKRRYDPDNLFRLNQNISPEEVNTERCAVVAGVDQTGLH